MPKGAPKLWKNIAGSGPMFFATLIENFPALIERPPLILNLKLKDKCSFLYLHGHKLANLEHELQRNVFSRHGSYN